MRTVSSRVCTTADICSFDETQLEVLEAFETFTAAKCDGDTADLDQLMEPGALYRRAGKRMQPRSEWFAELESGHLQFHSGEIVYADIEIDGDWAIIDPVVKFDALIDDVRKVWRMSIPCHMHRVNGQWLYSEEDRYLAETEGAVA